MISSAREEGKLFLNKSCRKQCHLATKLIREQSGPRKIFNTMICADFHHPYALKHRILSKSYAFDKNKHADYRNLHVGKTKTSFDEYIVPFYVMSRSKSLKVLLFVQEQFPREISLCLSVFLCFSLSLSTTPTSWEKAFT